MNNDNKVETAIAGLNCWASYATVSHSKYWSITTPKDFLFVTRFTSLLAI